MTVPFVAFIILGPVVLVVARAAATVSAITLAGVRLKDNKLPQRAGALTTNFVAVTLAGVGVRWEI